MQLSIVPCNKPNDTNDVPMKPWHALRENAFTLVNDSNPKECLFFFDSAPSEAAVPTIILIHGLGDDADSWRHLIPLLHSFGYRVLAFDLPGFGRSTSSGKLCIKSYRNTVFTLLDALKLQPETPVFLAGNSMGAVIAEAAALQKPDRIRALILLNGCIPGGPQNIRITVLAKILLGRKSFRVYHENPDRAWASLHPYYTDLENMPSCDKEFLRKRVMERVESSRHERAYFTVQKDIVRTFVFQASRFAKKIRASKNNILLIWGADDKVLPFAPAKAFANLRSGIELCTIPGAGHLPHQEKPTEIANLMVEFVQRNLHSSTK